MGGFERFGFSDIVEESSKNQDIAVVEVDENEFKILIKTFKNMNMCLKQYGV